MLSVTCNMLSFVRDSVGRAYAYAALKLSIIKQEWYQKVPQHNNWKTSMHRLHLSLGGGGHVRTFVKLPENPQDKVLYFFCNIQSVHQQSCSFKVVFCVL